ncbi:hypothetical protein SLS63_007940 [Diaporthe eres]|uniref:Uncharacterized protein n=1 Tax=Diaporthe eres TaxID=83184 RepID=A0ABR1P3X2_DIAER
MEQRLIQVPRLLGEGEELVSDRSEHAEAKADEQRRRIQNRKNQRARRKSVLAAIGPWLSLFSLTAAGLRLKGKDAGASQRPRPFEIRRWRLDEHDVVVPEGTSPILGGASTTHISPRPLHTYIDSSATTIEHTSIPRESQLTAYHRPSSTLDPQPFTFPLSSDHLLHLIQHNVFRAFITNKRALIIPGGDPSNCLISGPYRHDTSPHPFHPNIPPSLAPTTLQRDRYHSIWVSSIPFPRMRDNFIRHEGLFDPWDLMHDLIGDFMITMPAACVGGPPTATRRPSLLTFPSGSVNDADDEITGGRKGLIVWGEPHETQSWEATPGFLAKWAWAVEGCEELVETSNRWRMHRGEEPMRLSLSKSWSPLRHH